jgi:hypothetical protein
MCWSKCVLLVGMRGFEPRTSCSQSRRAAKLRYIPAILLLLLSNSYPRKELHAQGSFSGEPSKRSIPCFNRALWAANKSPKSVASYGGAANQLLALLLESGMAIQVAGVGREHVESSIERLVATKSAGHHRWRRQSLPSARGPGSVLTDRQLNQLFGACDGRALESAERMWRCSGCFSTRGCATIIESNGANGSFSQTFVVFAVASEPFRRVCQPATATRRSSLTVS